MGILDRLLGRYTADMYHQAGLKTPEEAASDFMILNEEVNEALFTHWRAGLESEDPAAMPAAVRRALPVLNRMDTLLEGDFSMLTKWGIPFGALADYRLAIRWYIDAGQAWLAGDREGARFWGIEASKKYDRAVNRIEAAGK